MSIVPRVNRKVLAGILLTLSMASLIFAALPARVSAAPSGAYFDHIVIIAMENTAYDSVFGSGTTSSCPTSSAPFLCSMLPLGSTLPNYNSYGATAADTNDFNGCSAACYVGFVAGDTYGVSDGYGSLSATNLVADRMAPAGLTWQVYCESGCPRGNDHFPFTSFTDTSSDSNVFAGSSVSTSTFISAPNLLYGTPVKRGYVSPDTAGIDEYASLWTIENNWGFSPLAQGDTAAANSGYMFNDIFTSGSGPSPSDQPPTCSICSFPGIFSTVSLLAIGLILGGASGATIFLVRYHRNNRRLRNMVSGKSITTANRRRSMSSQSGRVIRNGLESRFVERKAGSHRYDD